MMKSFCHPEMAKADVPPGDRWQFLRVRAGWSRLGTVLRLGLGLGVFAALGSPGEGAVLSIDRLSDTSEGEEIGGGLRGRLARLQGGAPWNDRPAPLTSLPMAEARILAQEERHTLRRAAEAQVFHPVEELVRLLAEEPVAFLEHWVSGTASESLGDSPPPGPLRIDLGNVALEPDRGGQWVTLSMRNLSETAVSIAGFNLSLQVADSGPLSEGGRGVVNGPNIQSVDLATGTLFAANNDGTRIGAATGSQAGQWSITTAAGVVVLGAGAESPIARVEFNTTGFAELGASWPLSLSLSFPGEGIVSTTTWVTALGEEWDVVFQPGNLTLVPEPWAINTVGALLLAAFAGTSTWRRRSVNGGELAK